MMLALLAAPSLAGPITAPVGSGTATIVVSPDPPQVGSNTVTVMLSGTSPQTLAQTSVRFATVMPSMNMTGPSGIATRVAGQANTWRFAVAFGMAAPWALRVQFAGGVNGAINANLTVGQAAVNPTAIKQSGSMSGASMRGTGPQQGMSGMSPAPSGGSMAGMNMSSGDASAWRNATFALIAVIVIGALVLWRNRRPVTIAMVVIVGLIIVGIAFAQSRSGSPSMDMASMQTAHGSAPIPVTLATIGGDPGGSTISAPANVQPYLIQNIVARAPGLLTDFNAYTGDRLRAGEIVAHLDEPELQSNAQAAQSAAQAAQSQRSSAQYGASAMQADVSAKQQQLVYWKAEIAREKSLLDQGAVSVQEYQNEKAQAAAAQSDYDSARAKLAGANAGIQAAQAQAAQAASSAHAQSVTAGYTSVVVSDDSTVMKRLVDPGVYVQAGTSILQVAVVNRLRVQAQVSQRDLAGVQIGTPIDIRFADGNVLHSRISSVSPVVDPNTHTAIAEAIVPNSGDRYQPGAFVHTILHAHGHAPGDSFTVPAGAIVGGATTAVWADENGTAHRVQVNVVSDDGTTAQVTGDLRPGTPVVVTGAQNLEEGQTITESGR